jgi:hydroxypyruvate isomerase
MRPFSVNLSTIFTEVPFIERFRKAKESGFSHVECQFPYDAPINVILEELRKNQLSLELINLPAGIWEMGDRGLAIFSDKIEDFKGSVAKGIEYACALGVPNIHCMAGILSDEADRPNAREIYLQNLKYAAAEMAQYNRTLLIEPLNPFDVPGYFLTDLGEAAKIIDEVGMPNVKLQFDFYHIQKVQGNLLSTFQKYFDRISHVQIADVPGRNQPGTGEIHYQNVIHALKKWGYAGFIGLEYTPKGKSEDSFKWLEGLGAEGRLQ